MRLTDEQIMDIKEYLNRSIKITISSLIPRISKHGLDLIDTIEALQQENEHLQAQVAKMREALEEATETIENIYEKDTPQTEKYRDILNNSGTYEALAEIDKAIGGKEDV